MSIHTLTVKFQINYRAPYSSWLKLMIRNPSPDPDPTISGPIVCSWWLKPIPDSLNPTMGVSGGYHSFAVKSLPDDDETVRLSFTTHLILSNIPHPTDPNAPSTPSSEIKGMSFKQSAIMYFHTIYSRILLDLAVRRLKNGAVWEEAGEATAQPGV